MGKISNKLVSAAVYLAANKTAGRKKLTLSVISLVLCAAVLVTSTVCWYMLKTAHSDANEITLTTDNGLRVNDVESSPEEIAQGLFMRPATSVDGRNLFFPADGDSFTDQTSSMYFRSANAGDKNNGYIQYDFYLTAEENYTSVYLDTSINTETGKPNTYLYFKGWNSETKATADAAKKKSRALRAAIYYEGMENRKSEGGVESIEYNKPIVFSSQNSVKTTNALSLIDSNDGTPLETATQTAVPFKNYSYGKSPVAILDKGERRRFSLIVWLEGTVAECTDELIDETIELNVKFTTSWENTEKITFVDENNKIKNILKTEGHNGYTLALFYDNPKHKIYNYRFNLYTDKDETQEGVKDVWYCNVPGTFVNDLTFKIIDISDPNYDSSNPQAISITGTNGTVICEWKYTSNRSSTLNRVDSTCFKSDFNGSGISETDGGTLRTFGHWYDGAIEDMGGGHDIGDDEGLGDDW